VIKDALPQGGVLVRMHGGWLSGRLVGFGEFQPITPGSRTQFFQSVGLILVPFHPGRTLHGGDALVRPLGIQG